MNRKFVAALTAYAGIAVLAGFTLDGKFRLFVWILLGAFALRTWLSVLRERMD